MDWSTHYYQSAPRSFPPRPTGLTEYRLGVRLNGCWMSADRIINYDDLVAALSTNTFIARQWPCLVRGDVP